MPFLPAFWKHHFRENDSAGYTRYSEGTHGAVEMVGSRGGGKHRATAATQKEQDCGSEENMLIENTLALSTSTPKRTSDEQISRQVLSKDPERFNFPPPPAFGGGSVQITKTVEIEQTYAEASEASLNSRGGGSFSRWKRREKRPM